MNVVDLSNYYDLVKTQTGKSFTFCVVAGGIGLFLITLALAAGFIRNAETTAYIGAAAGIITEFITAVFFYLYNRTTRDLKDYHSSLVNLQNALLSWNIVNT